MVINTPEVGKAASRQARSCCRCGQDFQEEDRLAIKVTSLTPDSMTVDLMHDKCPLGVWRNWGDEPVDKAAEPPVD